MRFKENDIIELKMSWLEKFISVYIENTPMDLFRFCIERDSDNKLWLKDMFYYAWWSLLEDIDERKYKLIGKKKSTDDGTVYEYDC